MTFRKAVNTLLFTPCFSFSRWVSFKGIRATIRDAKTFRLDKSLLPNNDIGVVGETLNFPWINYNTPPVVITKK